MLLSNILLFRVIRDKKTGKNKGFGFLSFGDPLDMARALTEMNGFLNSFIE